MEHRFLTLFVNGKWTGNADRTIRVNGEVHDMDEYAKQHGIILPDAKKTKKHINTDVKEKHEDMERPHHDGHIEVDGDGDSEG